MIVSHPQAGAPTGLLFSVVRVDTASVMDKKSKKARLTDRLKAPCIIIPKCYGVIFIHSYKFRGCPLHMRTYVLQ